MKKDGRRTDSEVSGQAAPPRPPRKSVVKEANGGYTTSQAGKGHIAVCQTNSGRVEVVRDDDFVKFVTDIVVGVLANEKRTMARASRARDKTNARPTDAGKAHPFIKALETPPEAGERLRALLHMPSEL